MTMVEKDSQPFLTKLWMPYFMMRVRDINIDYLTLYLPRAMSLIIAPFSRVMTL